MFTAPTALGIADGVGGWVEYGVDSSKFSNELMKFCNQEVSKFSKLQNEDEDDSENSEYDLFSSMAGSNIAEIASISSENNSPQNMSTPKVTKPSMNPTQILANAFRKVKITGSSTACICVLDQQFSELKVANLGDSGFLILRYTNSGLKIIYKSEEQQHSFNAPYQLTRMPRGFAKRHKIIGYFADHPDDADNYHCQVMKGDIVLLATDGLFDNLYTKDIINIVNKYIMKEVKSIYPCSWGNMEEITSTLQYFNTEDVHTIARKLSAKAWLNALSPNFVSPFSQKMKSSMTNHSTKFMPKIEEWRGGKKDDISVVIGLIS